MTIDPRMVEAVTAAIAARSDRLEERPMIVGLCGSQGSGKSTLATAIAAALSETGIATAILSLDDLYKTKADRIALADEVHPLFRTRGVPGTHDVALGVDVLTALREGRSAPLPRFDKSRDDRADRTLWPVAPARTQVLIFEGWFVGARPQPEEALVEPINALERDDDADARWRRSVNRALTGYRSLFAGIDLLVLLAAPSFAVVRGWRAEQEEMLRRKTGCGIGDHEIDRFIAHYERLTRHVLQSMPAYADLTMRLGDRRELREIVGLRDRH